MPEAPNLGYLFYYKYFRDEHLKPIHWKDLDIQSKGSESQKREVTRFFQSKNDTLTRPVLDGYNSPALEFLSENPEDGQVFYLKTMYPGLLIGSGYTHETGLLNELKLGFFFDHTSGLPLLPGSSVKGAVRSPFVNAPGFVLEIWQNLRKNAIEKAPRQDLEKVTKAWPVLNAAGLETLETEIFGARARNNGAEETAKKGKDIFYDAVPVLLPGEQNKKLLANDYITPHINRKNRALDAFTDPTPLQFLKVLGEVTFRFQFELTEGLLSKAQKLQLFQQIILQLGVGAKTNVGYGQFKI